VPRRRQASHDQDASCRGLDEPWKPALCECGAVPAVGTFRWSRALTTRRPSRLTLRARFVHWQRLVALNGGAPEAYIGATYNYRPPGSPSEAWDWVDGTVRGNLYDYTYLWSNGLAYSSTAVIPTG
jgi:hypothetical protein